MWNVNYFSKTGKYINLIVDLCTNVFTWLLNCRFLSVFTPKTWFKRRILHAPNQILILVDTNEYVRLIWFKRRIVLPNKIAEREWRVLNSYSSKHKLFNIIAGEP